MAIGTYTPNVYDGDGATLTFPYTFKIFETTDLEVVKRTVATGEEEILTIDNDYSVTGVVEGEGSPEAGGDCVLVEAPTSDYQIILRRSVPYTTDMDLINGDALPAEVVEQQIDKIAAMAQQLKEMLDRVIIQGATSTSQLIFPALVANGYVRVNDDGDGLVLSDAVTTTVGEYDGTISHGADASKPASPEQADVYFATDTGSVYLCKVAGAWTNIIPTATTSVAGMAELATTAETSAGTDTGRTITPAGLSASVFGQKALVIPVFAPGDTVTTGDGKYSFSIPAVLNGMNLKAVAAHVYTASSSGLPTVQIRKKKIADATEVDVLTTKCSIDANERDSSTAATAAVIDAANDDVATGDEYHVDVDIAGTGTKGLDVRLTFGV